MQFITRYSTPGKQNLETSLDLVHQLLFTIYKDRHPLSYQRPLYYPAEKHKTHQLYVNHVFRHDSVKHMISQF